MAYKTAYDLAVSIKESLEARNFISEEFKYKELGQAHHHKVNPKAYDTNAAELLWQLVHKYSRDYVKFKKPRSTSMTATTKSTRQIESVDDDNEFSEQSFKTFLNKITKLSSDAATKLSLMQELWAFRLGIITTMIENKQDMRATLTVIDHILAREFNINENVIATWKTKINTLFAKNYFINDDKTRSANLETLLKADPISGPITKYFADIKAEMDTSNETEEDIFANIESDSEVIATKEDAMTQEETQAENEDEDIFGDIDDDDFVIDPEEEKRRLAEATKQSKMKQEELKTFYTQDSKTTLFKQKDETSHARETSQHKIKKTIT